MATGPDAGRRQAPDPDALRLELLPRTHGAAATSADWDRPSLERSNGDATHA